MGSLGLSDDLIGFCVDAAIYPIPIRVIYNVEDKIRSKPNTIHAWAPVPAHHSHPALLWLLFGQSNNLLLLSSTLSQSVDLRWPPRREPRIHGPSLFRPSNDVAFVIV